MKLSPKLQRIKKWAQKYQYTKGFQIKLDQELANELYTLRGENNRALNPVQVWLWAFLYCSKTTKLYHFGFQDILFIDAESNQLTDGQHRIAGFLSSGIKKTDVIIVFTSGDTLIDVSSTLRIKV